MRTRKVLLIAFLIFEITMHAILLIVISRDAAV